MSHSVPKDGIARLYRVCKLCDQRRAPREIDECARCGAEVCEDCSWAVKGGGRVCGECWEGEPQNK